MLPIYICEDDISQLKAIEQSIKMFFSVKYPEITIHIYAYNNPESFLHNFHQATYPNIYFLDYMLNADINGLELARKIREKDSIGPITFITNYKECWNTSYKYHVSALNFIYKNSEELQSSISTALDECIKFYETYLLQTSYHSNKICSIKSGRAIHQIFEKDICYFEKSDKPHLVDIYTQNMIIHPRDTVIGILEKLTGDFFFQCNRSVVINVNHIQKLDAQKCIVYLLDRSFDLSKSKMKELKKLLNKVQRIV